MNSKEALERLLKYANINEAVLITKYGYSALKDVEAIKQDLDKIKKLEKENARLRTKIKKLEKELENADEYVWESTKWDYFL